MSVPTTRSISSKRVQVTSVGLIILCQNFQARSVGGIALFLPLIRENLNIYFTQSGLLSVASTTEKLGALNEMERTGGELDVVGHDKKTGEYIVL